MLAELQNLADKDPTGVKINVAPPETDRVAVNIGPGEQVVGIEVLDASEMLEGLKEHKIHLENLVAVS